MKADKTVKDVDLSSIPSEFRQNYRFLSELINCHAKNNAAAQELEDIVKKHLTNVRGKLNSRQLKILNRFLKYAKNGDPELISPPVPAELEASIRIRKRSSWLPWEAEAIRKIELWRSDVHLINQSWLQSASESKISFPLKYKSLGQ